MAGLVRCLHCGGQLQDKPTESPRYAHLHPPAFPHKPCPDGFNPENWGG